MHKESPMKPLRSGLTLLLAVVFLAGCNTAVVPSSSQRSPAYSLTLKITKADTLEGLESRYGGNVVLYQPEDGFAVLGLDTSELNTQGINAKAQANRAVFWGGGQLAKMGGRVSSWAGGSVSAWAGGSVSAWAGGRVSAWAGGIYQPLPQNTSKWQTLNLQEAQTLANNLGAGVKVAVIDSGIDLAHPAFEGGLVSASEMWDYVGNDGVPQEEGTLGTGAYGHGTNVASIVLQLAPKAKILPLRVLGPDGSGDAIHVAAAISHAVSQGADVINLSLGSDVRSEAVAATITAATNKGVYIVSSSGNTANTDVTYPANDSSNDTTTLGQYSVSVGSVDAGDKKSSFSTYGVTLEMVGPGELVYGPVPDKRLGAWSGTSMAAPMVSGAIALALGQTIYVPRAGLTDMLESRAANIYSQGLNADYEDEAQNLHFLGEGRLDVEHFIYDVTRP
jgi:thermitase